MEVKDKVILVIMGFLTIGVLYTVFVIGKIIERHNLTHALVESLDVTCNECYDIGRSNRQ